MKTLSLGREIAEAQAEFERTFEPYDPVTIQTKLGYQSGSASRQVYWIPNFGIWAHFGLPPGGKSEGGRFWNVFGIGKPTESESIVCEINPPFSGINKKTGGAFVRDSSGGIWVAHRGKFNVHGGMTMKFFRIRYGSDNYQTVDDGGSPYDMILIGKLASTRLAERLSKFVFDVDRIKDIARAANR